MNRIAAFDFDGTLIPGDSVIRYLRYAFKKRYISAAQLIRSACWGAFYKAGLCDETTAKTKSLSFCHTLPGKKLQQLDERFVLEDLVPLFRKDGLDTIRGLKEHGYLVWIVSASTRNYMQYVARELKADHLICTEFENDAVTSNCKGPEKVRRIGNALKQQGIQADLKQCRAYGDSKSDLPMLQAMGEGYLINAGKKLCKKAPSLQRLHWD